MSFCFSFLFHPFLRRNIVSFRQNSLFTKILVRYRRNKYFLKQLARFLEKLFASWHQQQRNNLFGKISIEGIFNFHPRLMTMSPLYPCGKPCSRGTHHETVKNLALFSSIINGIRKESRLRISIPWECFQFFNRIENSITLTR